MWNDGSCTHKEAGPTAGDLVPGSRRVEKKKKKRAWIEQDRFETRLDLKKTSLKQDWTKTSVV